MTYFEDIHQLSVNTETRRRLATSAQGLADSEAAVRLKQYGANELPEPPQWVLILSIIFLKPLEKIFATAPLAIWQWLFLLICPPILLGAEELRKRIVRSSK